MIDLTSLLNTDALSTIRDALESHVYWQLSDPQYRNNGYVLAPATDDSDKLQEIVACCELAREIDKVVEDDASWLPGLLDDLDDEGDPGYAGATVTVPAPAPKAKKKKGKRS